MKTTVLFLLFLSHLGFAHGNSMLQFTMKAISKDVSYVSFPAKQEFPADVTEEALVTAIARARTAAFQLQLVIDRKEKDFFPPILENLPEPEKKAKLTLFQDHLTKAIKLIQNCETQLLTEYAKSDPTSRDFRPLQKTLDQLEKAIKEAHAIFHPQHHS